MSAVIYTPRGIKKRKRNGGGGYYLRAADTYAALPMIDRDLVDLRKTLRKTLRGAVFIHLYIRFFFKNI